MMALHRNALTFTPFLVLILTITTYTGTLLLRLAPTPGVGDPGYNANLRPTKNVRSGIAEIHRCSHGESTRECLGTILSSFRTGKPTSVVNSENLRVLADALAPSEVEVAAAHRAAQVLDGALRQCDSVMSVDRTVMYGSLAKGTSLPLPDIDFLVIVNNAIPPFAHIFEQLPSCLTAKLPELEVVEVNKWMMKVRHAGFDVDLSMAPNMVPRGTETGVINIAEEQQKNTMEHMRNIRKTDAVRFQKRELMFMDSAFTESKNGLWDGAPKVAHDAARIAKLWRTGCLQSALGGPSAIQGFKSIVPETLALLHARDEVRDHPQDPSVHRVFRAILKSLSEPESMIIVFPEYYNVKEDVPAKVRNERPLFLDASPYINVAGKVKNWVPVAAVAQDSLQALDGGLIHPGSYSVADLFMCSASVELDAASQ